MIAIKNPETAKACAPIIEIERKFLIDSVPFDLSLYKSKAISQAYISFEPVIRIRSLGEQFFLTVKGEGHMKRSEFELELSKKQFDTLAAKKETAFLSKKRYFIPLENNLCCELDIYEDELAGLVTAEVEFPSQHEAKNFSPPDWFCKEVTFCAEYKNSNLARLGKP